MYVTISHLAKKYSIHPDTIRRKNLKEGIHFIRIGRNVRYDEDAIHELLTGETKPTLPENFFI